MVQGCVPQERRRDGQLLELPDKDEYRAEQRSCQTQTQETTRTSKSPRATTQLAARTGGRRLAILRTQASPYGTFDQGGNLWEWTDTVAAGLWASYAWRVI